MATKPEKSGQRDLKWPKRPNTVKRDLKTGKRDLNKWQKRPENRQKRPAHTRGTCRAALHITKTVHQRRQKQISLEAKKMIGKKS